MLNHVRDARLQRNRLVRLQHTAERRDLRLQRGLSRRWLVLQGCQRGSTIRFASNVSVPISL